MDESAAGLVDLQALLWLFEKVIGVTKAQLRFVWLSIDHAGIDFGFQAKHVSMIQHGIVG